MHACMQRNVCSSLLSLDLRVPCGLGVPPTSLFSTRADTLKVPNGSCRGEWSFKSNREPGLIVDM